MQKINPAIEKLRQLKNRVWEGPVRGTWNELNSRPFARKYAARTRELIREGGEILGEEAAETERMAQTFFRLLSEKLQLDSREEPPTPGEVKDAIEQLKDVGRLGIFVTLVILPGGVISLLGLEMLARHFGIRGFNLVPSSVRRRWGRWKGGNLPAKPGA